MFDHRGAIAVFRVTWGIRRIVFTIGAMLVMGGWGLTGYVDAYQHAAGAAAGVRWREGEQATTATLQRSAPVRTDVPDGPDGPDGFMADGEPAPRSRTVSRQAAAAMQLTRQVLPPSSWLYALGVVTMMTGAGLMALMVPWRGARMAAAAEAGSQHHYASPPPMKPASMTSSAAPSFAGVPPVQEARSMAAAAFPATAHEPPAKAGVKPLLYKKGA